jgi:ankyrin repeat protein
MLSDSQDTPRPLPNGGSPNEIDELKQAIDTNNFERVKALMTRNPSLHRAALGSTNNGPLTYAVEWPRREPPTAERLAILRWMLENGSDVHQGGDGPLRCAASWGKYPVMDLLVEYGADVKALSGGEYPVIFEACDTLDSRFLEWLLAHGADMLAYAGSGCLVNLLATAIRYPEGKGACLEVFARAGYSFPDTATMAVHRGRTDLLAALVDRDPALIHRRFRDTEIYPPELSIVGFTVAPLAGTTLLHMAVEYGEKKIGQWLIDHGADVNARAEIDAEGFGGHTPLFHTAVTFLKADDSLARLLLRSGADPNLRATFRWPCHTSKGDGSPREYHDVTAIGFANQFQDPDYVNEMAINAIREHGGE